MTDLVHIPQVFCAGRLYCDLVFTDVPRLPTLGTEIFAGGVSLHTGGGAFITAATLSALGQSTALLARVPSAPFDKIVESEIVSNGVDASKCVSAITGSDPQITVAIATQADRAFLNRRSGTALPKLTAQDLAGGSHLHIGELGTLQEHPELIALARAAGLTISLDCGWDDELMANVSGLAELIAAVDVFLPNEAEAKGLEELGIPATIAPLTVVKCGADGARVLGPNGWISATPRPTKVVDATGAGDAFNGGFIFEWLRSAPLERCLDLGNACGAAAVGEPGGTGGLSYLRDAPELSKYDFAK